MLIKPAISLSKNCGLCFLFILFVSCFVLWTYHADFLKLSLLLLFHNILKLECLLESDFPDLSFDMFVLLNDLGKDQDFLFWPQLEDILFRWLLHESHSDMGVDSDLFFWYSWFKRSNELEENLSVRFLCFNFVCIKDFSCCVFHLIRDSL